MLYLFPEKQSTSLLAGACVVTAMIDLILTVIVWWQSEKGKLSGLKYSSDTHKPLNGHLLQQTVPFWARPIPLQWKQSYYTIIQFHGFQLKRQMTKIVLPKVHADIKALSELQCTPFTTEYKNNPIVLFEHV